MEQRPKKIPERRCLHLMIDVANSQSSVITKIAVPVSPMTVATTFVDMISIASEISGEDTDFGVAFGTLRKSSSTAE